MNVTNSIIHQTVNELRLKKILPQAAGARPTFRNTLITIILDRMKNAIVNKFISMRKEILENFKNPETLYGESETVIS